MVRMRSPFLMSSFERLWPSRYLCMRSSSASAAASTIFSRHSLASPRRFAGMSRISYFIPWVESSAEADDDLMNKYLEGHNLSNEDIKKGLRIRTIKNEIVPMLCGSAFKNKGVQAMLDAVIDYLPAPVDIPPVKGQDEDGKPNARKPGDEEPFSALAFKIMTDPYVGQLTFFRVYSGVLNSSDTVYTPVHGRK